MPVPYSAEDLEKVFDSKILTSSRFMAEMTDVTLDGETITGTNQMGAKWTAKITPVAMGQRVSFAERECSCGESKCKHLAATALKALECFPILRKAAPKSLIDTIIPAHEREFPPPPPPHPHAPHRPPRPRRQHRPRVAGRPRTRRHRAGAPLHPRPAPAPSQRAR